MTPWIIRSWDQATAALTRTLADTVALIRTAADDPDLVEGTLRDHLREAAKLIEHLATGQVEMMRFNRRATIRFGWLSVMFFILVGFEIARMFWEGRLP